MEVIDSEKLPGVKLLKPEIHQDFRGDYVMTFQKQLYTQHGIDMEFVEHCISTSMKGVIRGIHTDFECDKLMEVLSGRIYYVVVDMDPGNPRWEAFILSGENHHQVFKPRQYGAAFQALTEGAVFRYLQSQYYSPERQGTHLWNDPRLNIWWPLRPPLLSRRDEEGHYV